MTELADFYIIPFELLLAIKVSASIWAIFAVIVYVITLSIPVFDWIGGSLARHEVLPLVRRTARFTTGLLLMGAFPIVLTLTGLIWFIHY